MSTTDLSLLRDSRDTDAIYADFLTLRRAYMPDYVNESDSDPGNLIARLFSGVADYLHLRHDMEAAQNIPSRVERRESARSILAAMGTDFSPPASAMCDVTVTITGSTLPAEDIPIGLYHAFSAPGPAVRFLVPHAGLYWPAGTRTFSIPVMHGEDRLAVVGTTSGYANQFFDIEDIQSIVQNATQRTCRVTIGDVEYSVVDTLAESGPTDAHIKFSFLEGGRGRLTLGNNRMGLLPPADEEVVVQAISGGGSAGNVGVGAISQMLTPLSLNGESFAVRCTNALPAGGGTDEESIRDAMSRAPRWWRAQDRAVSGGDTSSLALSVPGVLDATSLRTGLTVVTTYVLSNSASGYPGSELLAGVDGYLDARALMTDDHRVAAPSLVAVDVALTVRRKKRASVGITKAAVEAAVRVFFDLRIRKAAGQALFAAPGTTDGSLFTSDFVGFLENIPAVDSLDLTRFTRVIQPQLDQWSGAATITQLETSNDAVAETVTLRFNSATAFNVTGSVSGSLGSGVVGTSFSGQGMFSFLVSNSGTSMSPGDVATFRLGNVVGNVTPYTDGEALILGSLVVSVL